MAEEFIHPETQQGETFFINTDTKGFSLMEWNTKRKGLQTYDGEGNRIEHDDWFSVFIQKEELEKQNLSLQELRRKWREVR